MKTNNLSILLALLFVSVVTFGQTQKDYVFKVLANKGANEVKTGNAWQPLRTGASLKANDEVKLGDNAYIGLVHANGKPMEVKQSGVHKVNELASKVGGSTSVLNKYTDFILSSNSAEAKKNRLSATGAVHRAVDGAAISVMLPENQNSSIYNSSAVLNWEGTKVQGPFVVIVRNMFDDELARFETPETSMKLDLTDPKFASENALLLEVASKADAKQASKPYLMKRLAPAEQEVIKTSLQELMGEVSEENALNKLIVAGFYEEKGLLIDAISAYEEAIRLAPDVADYKAAYEEFLLRRGLKK